MARDTNGIRELVLSEWGLSVYVKAMVGYVLLTASLCERCERQGRF